MPKKTIIFFTLVFSSFEGNTQSDSIQKEMGFNIATDFGHGFGFNSPAGIYSFNELLRYKYDIPYKANISFNIKKKRIRYEIGLSFFRRSGESEINSGYLDCGADSILITNHYIFQYNYLSFHYGMDFPLKNDRLTILSYFEVGKSFESFIYDDVTPKSEQCYLISPWKSYKYSVSSRMFELGLTLNYRLIESTFFKLKAYFRIAYQAIDPEHNLYTGIGLAFHFSKKSSIK